VSETDELTQRYTGRCAYVPDLEADGATLLVAVHCLIQGQYPVTFALLDAASTWSLLPGDLAQQLGCKLTTDPKLPGLRTARCGLIRGCLERLWVRFPADAGSTLDIEVGFYLSAAWTGPVVLGWKGGRENLKFAVDPANDQFYFAGM
jgi:hypothetical protein